MLNIPEEVKNLFRLDSITKNFRVHFPNGEYADLVNKDVVEDSVQFTESLCSQENLKFGLCEASVLEFKTIGVGNIKNCEIEAGIEIDITSLGTDFITEYGKTSGDVPFPYYYVPYGRFVVDSCMRQSNTNKRQIEAYSVNQNPKLSPLEKLKQESRNINGEYYQIDVDRFVFCNIESPDIEFSVEEYITPENKEEIADLEADFIQYIEREEKVFLDDGSYTVKSKFVVINFGVVGSTQYFYKLNYEKNKNYMENTKEIIELINSINQESLEREQLYKDYITSDVVENFHIRLNTTYPAMTLNYLGKEYCVNVDSIANFNTNYLLSAYVGLDAEPKITIALPVSFSYKKVAKGENSLEKEFTEIILADCVAVTRLSEPSTDFFNISFQIEREQLADGRFGFKEDVLKEILSAYAELKGAFVYTNRSGTIALKEIQNGFGLYPSEDLYPAEDLYPNEATDIVSTYNHKTLFYEEYKTTEIDSVKIPYYLDGTKHNCFVGSTFNNTYSFEENYILNKTELEYQEAVEIATDFFKTVKGITYTPAELEMRGLPYIEAGDVLNVLTEESGIETFVFRRTLVGIQMLSDSVIAQGDEVYEDTTDTSITIEESV